MNSIPIRGVPISFIQQGRGPDLFLIHGLGAWSAVWEPLIGRLAGSFRITALDLPGHGNSGAVPAEYSLELLCDILREFPKEASLVHPLVIAHSFGCLPAAKVFSRKNARGLVLVSPFLGERQSLPWMKPLFSKERGRLFRVRVSTLVLRKAFLDLLYEPDALDPALLRRLFLPLDDEKVMQGILATSELITGNFGEELEKPAGGLSPVLVVCGREDLLVDQERLASLAHVLDAKLVLFDRCGHFPQIERPADLAHVISAFARA
jgi:pimeloyl-ACP methyl ester carboxylesterase